MRILQIANKFPYPAKGGGSIATLSLSRSFASLGHEVTVLAMNTSKHFVDLGTLPEELTRQIRFIGVPVNTDIRFFSLAFNFLFSSRPYNAERFIDENFRKELTRLLTGEKFDVVQMEGLYLAPYLQTIRKHSEALIAMRAHNIEHEIWERSSRQEKGFKRYYFHHLSRRIKKMEIRYLNQYDALLPITERDAVRLKELGCNIPVHVVPTGIDSSRLKNQEERGDPTAVFHIGALDWTPNIEGLHWFLEEIWPEVLQRSPALKLYIAGRNASPSLIRRLKQRQVMFLGEIDDAYEFMRSKGIMAVPLLSGSGMRIKIIEGMALGKAIVSTSIGTEGISTTHGENILVTDVAADFARYICELAENPERMDQIGKNARIFVAETYDNLAITKRLAGFFEQHSA